MTALGFLLTARPGRAARPGEDDYPRIEQLLGSDIRLDVVRVAVPDSAPESRTGAGTESGAGPGPGGAGGKDDAVRRLGPPEQLAAAGEQLRLAGAEAVVWASVSGSWGYGWEGARAQTAALARATGMPASATSLAFVHAVRELGARRVVVATAHPEPVAAGFADFLRTGGAEVTAVHAASPVDPVDPAAEGEAGLLALARAADRPDARAVLLPDTAPATVTHIPALERALGKPVLTASQVTVWEALRLVDRRINAPLLGALFTREPIVQVPPSGEW